MTPEQLTRLRALLVRLESVADGDAIDWCEEAFAIVEAAEPQPANPYCPHHGDNPTECLCEPACPVEAQRRDAPLFLTREQLLATGGQTMGHDVVIVDPEHTMFCENERLREQLATERDHHERTAAQLATVTRERAQDIDNAVKPGLREVARLESELDTLHKRIAAAEVLADRWDEVGEWPTKQAEAVKCCARELRAALTQDDKCAGS
jgi:hypothetical protein